MVSLEQLLAKHKGKVDRDFISKAISHIDRGERTVKDMLKQILRQKTE